jgi:uncharacterized protein (TIGR02646 family)
MRPIDRTTINIPLCLATSDSERRYPDLHRHEKEEIRTALLAAQKNRCAYCERRTGDERDDGHIEHFRKQANDPNLDMTWTNMLWSCNDEKTCGKHKDKCDRAGGPKARFSPDDLLNPLVDEPDAFLLFVTDGTVQLREGLDENNTRRAIETLRVFQLADSAYLRKSREDAVRPYINAIESLLMAGPELVRQYVLSELVNVEAAPFSAAIRRFFLSYSP